MSESFAVYNADCWCESCAAEIKKQIAREWVNGMLEQMYHSVKSGLDGISGAGPKIEISGKAAALADELVGAIIDYMDKQQMDTDDWPSCGCPEEAVDSPSHCGAHAECLEAEVLEDGSKIGKLLGTSLTSDGENYVAEQLFEGALRKDGPSPVEKFWAEQFSDYSLPYPMKVKVTDIDYDLSGGTDDDGDGQPPQLPKEMIVDVEENPLDNDAISEAALDKVSDITGWAVNSAQFQILNPASPNYPKE